MRDRDVAHTEDDMEVREAMSHCPQCGSGHFTAYPTEGPAPER
jgi:ribosomal protein S27AE